MSGSSPASEHSLPRWTIVLLGLISAIGPLSTDTYLPAFPQVTQDLHGQAELTLAAWFLGLAVGQISQGPVSDRWGRKLPLIGGISLYIVASVGCALVSNFWVFCLFRFFAAIGGSAGMVIPRAMVRDIATGRKGAYIMAQLALVSGIIPIVAPTLGSFILLFAHWRGIFWFSVLYGLIGITFIVLNLQDTLPANKRLQLGFKETFWRYTDIIQEPVFLSNTLIASFSSFVVFAYLGGTPAVYEHILHFSVLQFGLLFGANASCFILGTQINGQLVKFFSLGTLTNYGMQAAFMAGFFLLFLPLTSWGGEAHPYAFTLPLMALLGSLGFISPNTMVMAFSNHARHAGSASALLGTLQFSIGAVSGILIGILPENSIFPTVSVIMIGIVAMSLCNLWRQRVMRHGNYD
ncbi:multidrug effflux MFS transporter [Entomobacter blattae]|uniref:Bcr/CflA family efflux transporter n=1 Tax=Entomobacter blattae TaxID=2762277 RepID=A0A7H1NNZ1_9PROT|nr:multidrug effflux MFS transporter [Entomobacter blattae]QNT77501.1 Bicyclomycin resistance protein [Entomobacter blattae]